MRNWLFLLGWLMLGVAFAGAVLFFVTSLRERRRRPARIALILGVSFLGGGFAFLLLPFPGKQIVLVCCIVLAGLGIPLAFPLQKPKGLRIRSEGKRIDERDAIFHRFLRLRSGTGNFEAYYRRHPEKRDIDERIRRLPGLGMPGSNSYHPMNSAFPTAIFDLLEDFTNDIDDPPNPVEGRSVQGSPEAFSRHVKGFARHLGADLVGAALLDPAHVYSRIGRSPGAWGSAIRLDHRYALAFAVEMDFGMIRHAPEGPVITETAATYFEAAKVAILVARYIRRLGYEARAHVDGNYRVLCVPVAADAGLGELGRLGLLITPRFGPRVRLSVVTTDLPLVPDKPVVFGVQEFCSICRKCALNCPSGSIALGGKILVNGVEKWQSEQESCYRFWRKQGTDCAVCLRVCPFSHPDTFLHNVVRRGVRQNPLARRIAVWADDLLYGRRPGREGPLPEWHSED